MRFVFFKEGFIKFIDILILVNISFLLMQSFLNLMTFNSTFSCDFFSLHCNTLMPHLWYDLIIRFCIYFFACVFYFKIVFYKKKKDNSTVLGIIGGVSFYMIYFFCFNYEITLCHILPFVMWIFAVFYYISVNSLSLQICNKKEVFRVLLYLVITCYACLLEMSIFSKRLLFYNIYIPFFC